MRITIQARDIFNSHVILSLARIEITFYRPVTFSIHMLSYHIWDTDIRTVAFMPFNCALKEDKINILNKINQSKNNKLIGCNYVNSTTPN